MLNPASCFEYNCPSKMIKSELSAGLLHIGEHFIMQLRRCLSIGIVTTCLSISAWIAAPDAAFAQGAPSVSTVTLQVVPGQQGTEQVITPKGMVVPLPGAGVDSNSVQIYMGSQGGFWYVDRNGQNVDLTSYVERYRSMNGGQTAQVPQYAAAPQQPVNVYNQQASSGSSGASALGTAAAAGLGAMAGSAMSGAYYNNGYYDHVPYGTPMYYPHGGNPYYVNASGNTVNVNHSYEGASNNTAAAANRETYNNQHAENLQKQQDWYQNQQKQNPQQFKAWQQSAGGENPFVNSESQGRFGRGAQQADGQGRGGLLGRRGNEQGGAQGAGGRFGGGAAAEAGGGRFGGRLGGAAEGGGGGRLGRRGNR